VSTSLGIGNGNIRDAIHGELVVEATIITKNSAMTVRGILAKADVGANEKLGKSAADELNGLDDRALWVVGSGAKSVLAARLQRNTEEHDGS
jgi:hypothetical protein